MSKRRIYSDKFVERQIAAIDKMFKETQHFCPNGPDLSERPWQEKQLTELLNHRSKLSYIQGFWMGYSIRDGMKDE